jgi:hypothetical protein
MLQHLVSGDVGRISRDVELLLVQPVRHVVVFAAPAPEHVGKSVHLGSRKILGDFGQKMAILTYFGQKIGGFLEIQCYEKIFIF